MSMNAVTVREVAELSVKVKIIGVVVPAAPSVTWGTLIDSTGSSSSVTAT